ncbi:MAG: hypothetical protein NC247_05595 [Ruminococcus flavefaciens]|nr:hypothetical protein [Ruminococcus flavefaciens]MCM1360290.1 hypothetical protein [Clostridiales bacterium]MCM1435519.1 hypothetical protein [Ruminococcus flavefaciens]
MKNSLLKRAIAAAATVPLALSQCLTYSFAVTADDTAAPTAIADDAASVSSITLEKLLYIAPTETKSKWNNLVTSAIKTAIDSGNVAGSIEVESIFNTVASKAGTYSELVAAVLGQVTGVDYEIASNGDITITAEIDNVSEALSKDFNKSLGNAVKKLADECNVPELNDIDFTTVNASGTIKVVIAASALDAGTELPVTFEFAPSEGGTLGTVAAIEWAKSKVEEYRGVAYDKIDSLTAQGISINVADAKAEIDKSFDSYINQLNRAENGVKKAVVKNAVSKEYGSVENVIAAANRKLAKKNIKRTIPATGAAIASSEVVKSFYDVAIAEINKAAAPSAVDIELSEIGAFIDSLTSVNAGAASGVYTLSGKFDDAEAEAVAAYYNSNDELGAYVSSYKIITGSVDLSGANDSAASVDVEIERVVVTEPKTTTTTTSETTTTTTTTTTSDTTTTTTTTSVMAVEVGRYAEVESDYGFYIDFDKEFNKEQITSAQLHVVYNDVAVDEDGLEILDEDGNAIVLKEYEDVTDILDSVDFGDNTPGNTYNEENESFRYDVPVSYEGEELKDVDGNVITVEAYIGLKGDTDLNNAVDATDATLTLKYYTARISGVGGEEVDPYTLTLSNSELVDSPTSVYEEFAAFLSDVDSELSDNWKMTKADRNIDGVDATLILKYYTRVISNHEPGEELWRTIMSE